MATRSLIIFLISINQLFSQSAPLSPISTSSQALSPTPTNPSQLPVGSPIAPTPSTSNDFKFLDDGLLDPSWFGTGVKFSESKSSDFIYIKPNVSFKDKSFYFSPFKANYLRTNRQDRDKELGDYILKNINTWFVGSFDEELTPKPKWGSKEESDITIIGRLVDVNNAYGGPAMMFGAMAGQDNQDHATWEFKFIDSKTGDVLLACHHRKIIFYAFTYSTKKAALKTIQRWLSAFLSNDLLPVWSA